MNGEYEYPPSLEFFLFVVNCKNVFEKQKFVVVLFVSGKINEILKALVATYFSCWRRIVL